MGEEAADAGFFHRMDDDDERVREWEIGLPSGEDLTPLSQCLISPHLASAFSINPETACTLLDVHRASQHTVSNLRRIAPSSAAAAALRSFHPFPSPPPPDAAADDDPMVFEEDDAVTAKDGDGESSSGKIRRLDPNSPLIDAAAAGVEEAESSATRPENSNDDPARTLKRSRLVWTPQLHKRFVDVVSHLGIKNAVPKTIMQLMNVEGLTRENVASHLQKYRLYLKRSEGLSNEWPSSSDHLFSSTTPVPQSLPEQQAPMPMSYAMQTMFPMPVYGMAQPHGHQGYEAHDLYGAFGKPSSFGSMVCYPRVPNDK